MARMGLTVESDRGRRQQTNSRCTAPGGEVIGVYEPLIHVLPENSARRHLRSRPSLDVSSLKGDRYHLDCHTRLTDGRATS